MKIYRYNNRPTRLDYYSYQRKVITVISGPFDHNEFNDHFYKIGGEDGLKNWLFGFTKEQLISANLRAKDDLERMKDEGYKIGYPWNKESKLLSFEVPDEDILVLSDQVVFYAPSASLPIEQLR